MAVGFFVNDDDENNNSSYYTSVTNSATQTPLQSPVSREFLVQVFCEALNRCSIQSKYKICLNFSKKKKIQKCHRCPAVK